jgi:tellurite resistance protein
MSHHENPSTPASEAGVRLLALMVAANGRVDPRELKALEELGAYERLGVSREHFQAVACECLEDVGAGLAECSWLRARDQAYVDGLLDAVSDPHERLMLCRFAAAAVTADGRVSEDERLVYDHVLARWHLSHRMVTQAILERVERSG